MVQEDKIMSVDPKSNPFRLGFGLMRLPKNPDSSIDVPQVCEMTDRFIAAGGTYFDTAYVYDGGESEKAFKAAVADRYPRGAYTVATKLNVMAAGCTDAESVTCSTPFSAAIIRNTKPTACGIM